MSSVRFQGRGRSRVPLSIYAPLRVNNGKALFQVLPNNAVPTNKGGKNEQIGYWNEQPRWRMRRGERVELPSNWHFYYHGTGPHADAPYRKRIEGVFWVAKEGARTDPTNMPTRKASEKPLEPQFSRPLPKDVEIVEPTTPQSSRGNSRSRSRGPSRNPSNDRGNAQQSNNRSRAPSQSRNSRSQSSDRSQNTVDIVAAVREALSQLGIQGNGKNAQKPKSTNNSKPQTRNPSRAASKERSTMDLPEWRRVPKGEDSVERCFGPRGGHKNFGDAQMLEKGTEASGYAQIAALVPNTAAVLFGGNVQATELADDWQITYTYRMTVPKSDKNIDLLLAQIDAYKNGSKPRREKRQNRQTSSSAQSMAVEETPQTLDWASEVEASDQFVEVIDEVFDSGN